jgi:hypothetical protein
MGLPARLAKTAVHTCVTKFSITSKFSIQYNLVYILLNLEKAGRTLDPIKHFRRPATDEPGRGATRTFSYM